MKVSVEGSEATSVVASLVRLLDAASGLMLAARKKAEWESAVIEQNMAVTDEELKRKHELDKWEYDARMAKAKAEVAESFARQRRVSLQQQNLNKALHKPKTGSHPTQERRSGLEGKGGNNAEGKLTHNLGDKLQKVEVS